MKARLLRKLLNDTRYNISNNKDYIAVGSPYVHDLISVDKKTLKVKYALDTFHGGRKAIKHAELESIWDKLHELIESGQIHEVINGKDEIENPLPVFSVDGGQVVESVTDAYGWPNTDDDGNCMYGNTHFKTKGEAIDRGIESCRSSIEWMQETLIDLENRVKEQKDRIAKAEAEMASLKSLKGAEECSA